MQHVDIPSNPFLAALIDSAPLTYLSMLGAGLAERFDPIPRSASGLGMSSNLLATPIREYGAELCQAMIKLGLDPTDEQELSERNHCYAFNLARNELGRQSAPLASLAIASNADCYATFWTSLPPDRLRTISDTALPMALCARNMPALEALIAAKVDLNRTTPDGTPFVALCQNSEFLAKMCEAGANLRTPLPRTYRFKDSLMPLDHILAMDGQAADTRAMRDVALAWAASHPPEGDPLGEFAASAFKALAEDNKDAARRCVLAMGPQAIHRRNADGESLAFAAARARNYAELSRLLALGADPFEVTARGESVWGALMTHKTARFRDTWNTRVKDEKANSLLDQIATKRKYKPVPWTRTNAQGFTLIESLLVDCPLPVFFSYAQSAFSHGVDPRAPLSSGMDLSCDLALRVLRDTPWVNAQRDLKYCKMVEDFLEEHPIQDSSPACKAALARSFWQVLSTPQGTLLREPVSFSLLNPFGPKHPTLAPIILEGFEQLGRQGWSLPDLSTLDERRSGLIGPEHWALILTAVERGALKAEPTHSSKSSGGPSRL